jgi:YYY domain-containing protein
MESFNATPQITSEEISPAAPRSRPGDLITLLLLTIILLGGLALRMLGIFWGEYQYLHPDERFLLMVGSAISPTKMVADPITGEAKKEWMSVGEYFDTANSTLNPHNVGYGFYVYGTLPMFVTRVAAELIYGHSGLQEMTNVGRTLSALIDLLAIAVVFLIADTLYSRKVGLLASAFYALAVLPIQQSHFFTTDTWISFFTLLAVYVAICVAKVGKVAGLQVAGLQVEEEQVAGEQTAGLQVDDDATIVQSSAVPDSQSPTNEVRNHSITQSPNHPIHNLQSKIQSFLRSPFFGLSILFGVVLGCAVASKLNAAPVAFMLPAAFGVWLFKQPNEQREKHAALLVVYLALAAFVSLLTFRIAQPYAFSGPGFFGVTPNMAWVQNIVEQRAQASGDVDFPPAIQWARRSITFSAKNLTIWGLGLPLGLLAWAGFLWASWRIFTNLRRGGEWEQHILLWGWTLVYFAWQSIQINPTMRYQMPIYPMLVIFAAWAVVEVASFKFTNWKLKVEGSETPANLQPSTFNLRNMIAAVLGTGILIATAAYAWNFVHDVYLTPITRVAASRWIFQNIPAAVNVHIQGDELYNQPLPWYRDNPLMPGQPFQMSFIANADGTLSEVYLHKVTSEGQPGAVTIKVASQNDPSIANAEITAQPEVNADGQTVYSLKLDQPFPIVKGNTYNLSLEAAADSAPLYLNGSTLATEGAWDDAIPLRVDGYDGYGGIYQGGMEFNMYDDDTEDKRARMQKILDSTDYILMSSNRQWGSLAQIPERFPLSLTYYHNLLGCPPEDDHFWCYAEAKPGMFTSQMGFDLVAVFESPITIGPLTFNDQFAEEAFSVYDHPKVHIFKKNASYSSQKTAEILNSVDLTQVIHVTPKKAGAKPKDLLLPAERWAQELAGGTWSELFSYDNLINRFPLLGLILWYLAVMLLGWVAYPLVRAALPGLKDRGYPLARIAGFLLLAWLVWAAGSAGIAYTRLTITLMLLVMVLLSAGLAYWQREELSRELREKQRYFLAIEGLFLAFFLFDLIIRLGNPDLWHAYKGGEKPMDFAYFNAVIKSTVFPPYDPWFAGGYLNYYYYGFMVASVMVKWLGIVPSIAYNILLPTWFAMTGLGAFSVAWNLVSAVESRRSKVEGEQVEGGQVAGLQVEGLHVASEQVESGDAENWDANAASDETLKPATVQPVASSEPVNPHRSAFNLQLPTLQPAVIAGLAAAIVMVVLGNLATPGVITDAWARMVAPVEQVRSTNAFQFYQWMAQGMLKAVGGEHLPLYPGDIYWIPSRAIPAPGDVEPITEFPFFTFLYADPHAHLWVLPMTLLALAWVTSFVLKKNNSQAPVTPGILSSFLSAGITLFLGALTIGALWPTNTWDYPTYLAIGVCAVAYAQLRYFDGSHIPLIKNLPTASQRILAAVVSAGLLVGLSVLLYQPYAQWYGAAYTKVEVWKGTHTPLDAYLTHWGLFLFVIVSWLAWEARDWMASTPLSSVRKLQPYQGLIYLFVVLVLVVMAAITIYFKASITWFVLLLAAWAGVLLLRPKLPDAKLLVLFLFGTALVVTLMVEMIVIVGDIGRMNMVFKFYLQAWTIFSVCGGAALGWMWPSIPTWTPALRSAWKVAFGLLVAAAALYTVLAGKAKIDDRMVTTAPHTLDGMTYMKTASYSNLSKTEAGYVNLDLNQDYQAIRWMQDNVVGSPVVVEAATEGIQYQWFSRFSIYTGLPTVVGWQWHQEQQRAIVPGSKVALRGVEVRFFYEGTDRQAALDFLTKYKVGYIVVGQLERAFYPGPGLDKFEALKDDLWREVYRDREMVIYEVIE